jgi:hypothetical protein
MLRAALAFPRQVGVAAMPKAKLAEQNPAPADDPMGRKEDMRILKCYRSAQRCHVLLDRTDFAPS